MTNSNSKNSSRVKRLDVSPVLVLTYARIPNTINILELLLKSTNSNIFIFQDAPRTQAILESQKTFFDYLKDLPKKYRNRIRMKRNDINQGIAVSMISAIDWFFRETTFGIILEDDLVFNLDFLRWCMVAQTELKYHSEIFLISGNRYNKSEEMLRGPTLTRYPQTWGWATWRDRWVPFRRNIMNMNISSLDFLSRNSSFWLGGSLRVLAGKTDTWDILLARYMYTNRYFSVLPSANLVSNIGDDTCAVHTSDSDFPIRFPIFPLQNEDLQDISACFSSSSTNHVDEFLEQKVFNMKKRHIFSSYKNIGLLMRSKKLLERLQSNSMEELEIP